MKRICAPILILALAALACGFPGVSGMSEAQVATFAAGTVQALDATRAAQPPTEVPTLPPPAPTETAVPGTPTPVPPTPTAGVAGCTDLAGFIADVTVPDDSDFAPGANIVKTWRLRNSGTCTWTSSYALVFDHGDKMGGPDAQPLSGAVAPGSSVDLSVNLTAPAAPGAYQGFWKLRNSSGVLFGLGGNQAFWVKIEVPGPATATPTGFLFSPGLIITIIPLLYTSSGSDMAIASGECFDLDAGAAVGCGTAQADFRYDITFAFPAGTDEEVTPRNGAKFRFFDGGADIPTGAECQALALGGGTFDANSDVFCYQTSAGKYGYLNIDAAGFAVQFDWGTYTFP